jgi:hypothetical protein
MAFVLPSKREAGVLMNSDLSKEWEGNKVLLSDGTEINWAPAPPKPVMPDWSEIKSIRHYFNRSYKNNFWPAWLYNHETGEERVVKDADEAADLGVCYRETTADEQARFGQKYVWDWKDDTHWRPTPKPKQRAYDPRKPEAGKEFVATPIAQSAANRDLLNTVLPEVTAAVVAALKQGGNVAPDKVDPKQWDEFLAFQAWKKTQEAVNLIAADDGAMEEVKSALSVADVEVERESQTDKYSEQNIQHLQEQNKNVIIEPALERAAWVAEAKSHGIKVDGRWGVERIKEEIEKAA